VWKNGYPSAFYKQVADGPIEHAIHSDDDIFYFKDDVQPTKPKGKSSTFENTLYGLYYNVSKPQLTEAYGYVNGFCMTTPKSSNVNNCKDVYE
jgi:hypothetical protein